MFMLDARTIDGAGGLVHFDDEGREIGFTPIEDLEPEWIDAAVFGGPFIRVDRNHGTVQHRYSVDVEWTAGMPPMINERRKPDRPLWRDTGLVAVAHDPVELVFPENCENPALFDFSDVYQCKPELDVRFDRFTTDAGPISISHWGMIDLGRFGVVYMSDGAHWQEDGETFAVVA